MSQCRVQMFTLYPVGQNGIALDVGNKVSTKRLSVRMWGEDLNKQMSKDDKYRSIITCLRHKSQSKVNHALGVIRSKLLKEKGSTEKLCGLGFMAELFRLARTSEVTDTARLDLLLSILSNMCMEKSARKAVNTILYSSICVHWISFH